VSEEDEVTAILDDEGSPDESGSQLWHDLSTWVFAHRDPEIPSSNEMTTPIAETLLEDAVAKVGGLQTAEDWRSAARYFQAENVHGLARPAARRALALAGRSNRSS
jgi:hypothetical protein